MKLYLQNNVKNISFEDLPLKWQDFNLKRFSLEKTLFDFQENALKNALKALYRFYIDEKGDKTNFFNDYLFEENFDYDLNKRSENKFTKYFQEFESDYKPENNIISFSHFINRMSFWMATGSGKTLIIVKLIELLGRLKHSGEIPKNDILFLTHREDLLEQFKNHIEEFNSFNFASRINLKSLKDFEDVKHENALPFSNNEITVFYYRSDLISDVRKEKIVNFRTYDNNGKWYILLDEAHKGDKEDSKRQLLYSILSRNGFLFNFSATFTDPRDFATCVFNFNLSKYIEEGYGKHIYISESDMQAFRDEQDFSEREKQKTVLKTLILHTYISKYFSKIRNIDNSLYHKPLILTLVNSVNTEDSDLELFFKELDNIAYNEPDSVIFNEALTDLNNEFSTEKTYYFEDLKVIIDKDILKSITYKDILKNVFNTETSGKIEVLKIPGNRQELIFRVMTTDRPFALIKIGDISDWLKEKLDNYEISEKIENESIFRQINQDDSDVNILLGSRSFYEGWDSNRPNIILFVNIGVGSDSKKFVLQSVGRGVRIEPQKNKRKRMQNLFQAKEIDGTLFNKINQYILPIESLYVFGTKAGNLKEIIKTLQEEKSDKNVGDEFTINSEAAKRLLLIPIYKESENIFAEENEPQKFSISKSDFNLAKSMFEYLGEKVATVKYDCDIRALSKLKMSFENDGQNGYFQIDNNYSSINIPDFILKNIFNYFNVRNKIFDKFKKLEDEIVHFRKIEFSNGGNYSEFLKSLGRVKNFPLKENKEKEIDEKYKETNNLNEYKESLRQLDLEFVCEVIFDNLKIKYIQNHYYIPIILSEKEKFNYITHIINVGSEVRFIKELDEYLKNENNYFSQFDWWMFSKLDATLDNIYIPYYNTKTNNISKFYPDFIFWMQKGTEYFILFIDPKGTEYTSGYRKIDGYSRIFETPENESKVFKYNNFNIRVKLLLKPAKGTTANVSEKYRNFWFDNISEFEKKL
jgi:superfamily II DNA or RNA helicase